jgi:hypothetical protein
MDDRVKDVLLGGPSGAVDFPSAMARQSVDEAMNELPSEHRQVIKLAYFAGLTNREIATQLGLTVGGVRRRLRQSLATIGAYVDRGRTTGRRAVHGLAIWFTSRHLDRVVQRSNAPSLDQVLQAGAVAAMTVTAAILMAHHNPPVPVSHPHKAPRVAAVGLSPHSIPVSASKTLATVTTTPQVAAATVEDAVHQATSVVSVPINIDLPVRLPIRLPTAPSL